MKVSAKFSARAAILLGATLLLAGCGEEKTPEPVNLTSRQTSLYRASCQNCHNVPETGAPQSHDLAAWKPRMEQGNDTLLDHILNGYKGMPPLGQCIECSRKDFLTLAHYMAAPAPTPKGMQDEDNNKETGE